MQLSSRTEECNVLEYDREDLPDLLRRNLHHVYCILQFQSKMSGFVHKICNFRLFYFADILIHGCPPGTVPLNLFWSISNQRCHRYPKLKSICTGVKFLSGVIFRR